MPGSEGPRWTQVVVAVGPGGGPAAELVADRLWAHGPAAVEERSGPGGVELVAGFADRATAEAAAADAVAAGGTASVAAVDDDGLDGWRRWARVERAGPFDVVPAWLDPPPAAPGRTAIRLDPGRAFGSGSHATTRLVLARLAELLGPAWWAGPGRAGGPDVLDVGCGSGVLAVAAAVGGAARVHALDVDPAAVAATAANAAANGVGDRVTTAEGPLGDLVAAGRTYDLVLANLLAPVVAALAPDLVAVLRPGGRLVVSGLLEDRWGETVGLLGGVEVVAVDREDGWVAVTVRPTSSTSSS